jgi:hypothetical protein
MSTTRALPYLILAVVLGAAGYLAGAVTDPFRTEPPGVRGDLAPEAPRLRRELEQARGEAASLTGELERSRNTIDRLRTQLEETRGRIAELQRRAEAAERARAEAETRVDTLSDRVAALESAAQAEAANAENGPSAAQPTMPAGADSAAEAGRTDAPADAAGAAASRRSAPPALERQLAPTPQALSAITPTTAQANRLVAGVESYQEAAYEEAFLAWLPLAQQGYARAQLHLGALFLEGRGTTRNDTLAYAWLTIARDNGSQNAGPLLAELRARMSETQLAEARRLLEQDAAR